MQGTDFIEWQGLGLGEWHCRACDKQGRQPRRFDHALNHERHLNCAEDNIVRRTLFLIGFTDNGMIANYS
jgi:hypothetical protein